MGYFQINEKLLPMKIHYFFAFGGNAPIMPLLSIILKQRGYSVYIVGLLFMILPLPTLIIRPSVGAITDKYKCRKLALILCLALNGLLICLLTFLPGQSVKEELNNMDLIKSPLFWTFVCITFLLKSTMVIRMDTESTICMGLLGQNDHKFGEQRMWGAVGWGTISIISGACVDWYSKGLKNKDFTPGYVISFICVLIDLYVVSSKLEVVQMKYTNILASDVKKVLTNIKIVAFLLWITCFGMFWALILHFEFWYLEDISNFYHPETKSWINTLQGLIITIQCFGGEVPFFFLSKFIMKYVDHMNVFSIMFFAYSLRFFLYSIIRNPVWVLPVALLNGLTYAIPFSVGVSYAACVAPVGAEGTLQGIVGTTLSGIGMPIGSFVGGYLFEHFGSIGAFKLLSVIALITCVAQIAVNQSINFWSPNREEKNKTDPKTKTDENLTTL